MSILLRDDTGYRKVVGSPNETTDGKPGSYHETECFKFIYDPSCQGLYCQSYPLDWRVQIMIAEDSALFRQMNEHSQKKLLTKKAMRPSGQSQLQIEMTLRRKKRRQGNNFKHWGGDEPDWDTIRINRILEWRTLNPSSKVLTDRKINQTMRYRIDEDPDFYAEVARGEWD